MTSFDDYEYTRNAIIEQLSLIELHAKDGSAVDGGCGCIENKHMHILSGLSSEMVGFSKTQAEKNFYESLGNWARQNRKKIEYAEWSKPQEHCVKCDNLRGAERAKCLIECHGHEEK